MVRRWESVGRAGNAEMLPLMSDTHQFTTRVAAAPEIVTVCAGIVTGTYDGWPGLVTQSTMYALAWVMLNVLAGEPTDIRPPVRTPVERAANCVTGLYDIPGTSVWHKSHGLVG